MSITNATTLRKDLYTTLDTVIRYNEPVTVTAKAGNAVILSESDYNALLETVFLMSQPGVVEEYKKAKEQSRETYRDFDPDEEW